ncbi:MAG: coproporphyrinogen III oxidase, partial [Oscillospiraceae bacterium]|nr:coproporphyrinogen III oxidase [Oscillospiraceae bacterium]
MGDYRRALTAHLSEAAPQASGLAVDTVYFGGGTPSFYGCQNLIALLKWIKKKYSVSREAEITLEANPD